MALNFTKIKEDRWMQSHLPKLQFAAVCITIVLGAHTIYNRFFQVPVPVIEWTDEGFGVAPGNLPNTWFVTVSRNKLRDDCSLKHFENKIQDSQGFLHILNPAITRTELQQMSTGVSKYSYYVLLSNSSTLSLGPARLKGVMIFTCQEDEQVIYYPDNIGLNFIIEESHVRR